MIYLRFEICAFWFLLIAITLLDARSTYHSVFGSNRYIEWQMGSLNVILAVPHGGYWRPRGVENRRPAGCYVKGKCVYNQECKYIDYKNCRTLLGRDTGTQELAKRLADDLETLTSKRPHVIINHLYRGKLDPNRHEDEATFGDNCSKKAFRDFHKFISAAKTLVDGPGLLLDIHGHSHPEGWLELGYTVSASRLNRGDFKCTYTSIETLAKRQCGKRHCSHNCLLDIVRGGSSLGGKIMEELPGLTVVPSPANPCPGQGNYYSGGYIIRRHGSKWYGGDIDGIQVESPPSVRTESDRPTFSWGLAKAIKLYLDEHYNNQDGQCHAWKPWWFRRG